MKVVPVRLLARRSICCLCCRAAAHRAYDDAGSTGKGVPKMKEHIAKVPSMKLTVVKGEDIRAGVLWRLLMW